MPTESFCHSVILAKRSRPPGFATVSIHGGQRPHSVNGARTVPLYQTCSYNFEDAAGGDKRFSWSTDVYLYTRMSKLTNAVFDTHVVMLEGRVGAVTTASGNVAQFMALTQCCEPGHDFVSTS
ncbi:Cys/Met metabolism PLP-dependent enzyme-domain-containing protein [Diaporthe sp. PMI_573]|nr:Cys/Met metabolism PLP-dependent enzyme-domain-containing protein [Diaporthaceae sp. PMI_573]